MRNTWIESTARSKDNQKEKKITRHLGNGIETQLRQYLILCEGDIDTSQCFVNTVLYDDPLDVKSIVREILDTLK